MNIIIFGYTLVWSDLVGTVGVSFILIAYFLLQTEKVRFNGYRYLLLNAVGSALITVSLFYTFNFASFVIECFWLTISLYGLVRRMIKPAAT